MKHSFFALIFLLAIITNIAMVQGATTIEPYAPQTGPSDTLGADRIVSFFELPLWVQAAWIISVLLGIFGAIKYGALILEKVKITLQNKNRAAILEYMANHPGCTITDLSKNTGINRGTVKYHLSVLLIERKIVRKNDGKLSYLFANAGPALEKKQIYGYIMSHPKQEILTIILNEPGISNKEIAERLLLDQSTVYWHLRQFLDEKMVVSRWDGRNMKYSLSPDVEDILKKYRK